MCYYSQALTCVLKGLGLGVFVCFGFFLGVMCCWGFLFVLGRLLFVAHRWPALASLFGFLPSGLAHLGKRKMEEVGKCSDVAVLSD